MNTKEYNNYKKYLMNNFSNRVAKELLEEFINDTIIKSLDIYDENRNTNIKTLMYKILDTRIKYYYIRENKFKNIELIDNYIYDEYEYEYDFEIDEKYFEIEKYIKSLDIDLSLPFYLFYFKDVSLKEISCQLNINLNTLKSRLFKVRKLIKNKYINL